MDIRSSTRPSVVVLRLAPLVVIASVAACGGEVAPQDSRSTQEALGSVDLADILQIEDHRRLGDPTLAAALSSGPSGDPAVLAAAATAVGRIGDTSLETSVVALLDHPRGDVRQAAAFALGQLSGSAAEAALDSRLAVEHDTATRVALLQALARAGTATSVPAITALLASGQPSDVQAGAAEAYGTLVKGGVAPSGDPAVAAQLVALAGSTPDGRSIPAAYALSTTAAHAAPSESSLTAALGAASASTARAYLTTALASLGTTTSVQTLATAAAHDADARVRAAACAALAKTGSSPAVLSALSAALGDASPVVVVGAANAIRALATAAASLAPALASTYDASSSAWVRSAVLPALVAVAPASARARVVAGLSDAWPVQLAAIAALPAVATASDVTTLTTLATGSDTRLSSAAIEAIAALAPSLVTPAVKTAMTAALATGDWEIVSSVADVAVAFDWTDFAPKLSAIYDSFAGDANMNARIEIVYALGTIGSSADLPLLQRALADDTVLVSQTAATSYTQLSGTDVSSQVRKENVVTTPTPSRGDVVEALGSRVVLETTRGTIVIRLRPEAPLNAVNFVKLAASGFYDGLPFHRVVPNFVAQGGDPRGDGSGGSKNLVRDELSRLPHALGTVGLASEGKDTGSSQFFFNDGWNVSLDERYTVFGEIVSGTDVAERIEVGDVIESATVRRGSSH